MFSFMDLLLPYHHTMYGVNYWALGILECRRNKAHAMCIAAGLLPREINWPNLLAKTSLYAPLSRSLRLTNPLFIPARHTGYGQNDPMITFIRIFLTSILICLFLLFVLVLLRLLSLIRRYYNSFTVFISIYDVSCDHDLIR